MLVFSSGCEWSGFQSLGFPVISYSSFSLKMGSRRSFFSCDTGPFHFNPFLGAARFIQYTEYIRCLAGWFGARFPLLLYAICTMESGEKRITHDSVVALIVQPPQGRP